MEEAILDKDSIEKMKERKWKNAIAIFILSLISILMILGCVTQFMSMNISSGIIYLFVGICLLVAGL